MKVFASEHDFDYPWDEVSTANWRKYCPWNKESSHVLAVDTLSRRFDPSTGMLRTERLITCKQSTPRWLSSFLGGQDVSHVYEVSYVTPPKHPATTDNTPSSSPVTNTTTQTPLPLGQPSVRMDSRNLTYSDLLSVRETVRYVPSPSDPLHKTRFEQRASITALCGGWQKVRERIEGFTVERFGQNAERGRHGFEEVLEMSRRVFGEGGVGEGVGVEDHGRKQ